MSSSNLPFFEGLNEFISLDKARQMIKKYRDEKENILIRELQDMGIMPVCETFNREMFDKLLQQDGCVGLRTYPGMDGELKIRLITVGVNVNGEDMLPPGNLFSLGSLAPDCNENEITGSGIRDPA